MFVSIRGIQRYIKNKDYFKSTWLCRIDEKSFAVRLTENFQTAGRGSFINRLRLRGGDRSEPHNSWSIWENPSRGFIPCASTRWFTCCCCCFAHVWGLSFFALALPSRRFFKRGFKFISAGVSSLPPNFRTPPRQSFLCRVFVSSFCQRFTKFYTAPLVLGNMDVLSSVFLSFISRFLIQQESTINQQPRAGKIR